MKNKELNKYIYVIIKEEDYSDEDYCESHIKVFKFGKYVSIDKIIKNIQAVWREDTRDEYLYIGNNEFTLGNFKHSYFISNKIKYIDDIFDKYKMSVNNIEFVRLEANNLKEFFNIVNESLNINNSFTDDEIEKEINSLWSICSIKSESSYGTADYMWDSNESEYYTGSYYEGEDIMVKVKPDAFSMVFENKNNCYLKNILVLETMIKEKFRSILKNIKDKDMFHEFYDDLEFRIFHIPRLIRNTNEKITEKEIKDIIYHNDLWEEEYEVFDDDNDDYNAVEPVEENKSCVNPFDFF